jgi:competence ComEA-like helix-hairpin-helix protein
MLTPERRALLLLLALAVAGQGVHYLLTKPGEPAGGVQLLATLAAGSPMAQRDSAMRQGRPLAEGEQIDVDLAPASELARLPKVGPRLAKTIVADRQEHGAFGSLEALDRVAGIGPGLLKTIGPHVAFSEAAGLKGAEKGLLNRTSMPRAWRSWTPYQE